MWAQEFVSGTQVDVFFCCRRMLHMTCIESPFSSHIHEVIYKWRPSNFGLFRQVSLPFQDHSYFESILMHGITFPRFLRFPNHEWKIDRGAGHTGRLATSK
jgi:hypothetical protein